MAARSLAKGEIVITREVRDEVRRLHHYRCAFCGVSEAAVGNELEIDHFQLKSVGGSDELKEKK